MADIYTVANAIDDGPLLFKTDDGSIAVAIFQTEDLAYDFARHCDSPEANAPYRLKTSLALWLDDMKRLNGVSQVSSDPTPDTVKQKAVPIDVLLLMLRALP